MRVCASGCAAAAQVQVRDQSEAILLSIAQGTGASVFSGDLTTGAGSQTNVTGVVRSLDASSSIVIESGSRTTSETAGSHDSSNSSNASSSSATSTTQTVVAEAASLIVNAPAGQNSQVNSLMPLLLHALMQLFAALCR